jgi:DNA invertase Pin-like site-specific DNA recombinase
MERVMVREKSNLAVGYVRVSTDDQADSGLSLEHQEARIRAYAEAHGLELVEIIHDEGVSAGKHLAARKGGIRALHLLNTGKARHIIALKLDRVFRRTADALETAQAWDKAGVGLHLIDMGGQSINTRSAMGRMFFTMAAGFAELERGLVSERTAAALGQKKARGEAYSRPIIGFDREADGKRLIPNHGEQRLIARIQALRQAGESLHQIANKLNVEGVPTKRGGVWHASTIKQLLDRLSVAA